MRIITLLENRTISEKYKNKHGLSMYIETAKHKILFDTGTDDTFVRNAEKLGVKLENVDIAIISHGHYDHGGGLGAFLKLNTKAKIYIGRGAFDNHVVKLLGFIKFSIGLNKELSSNNRLVFVDKMLEIDDELTLFGDIKGNKFVPKGNDRLLKEYSDKQVKKDDFQHEINLLINENGRYNLFCGCAHKGIINIIEKAKEIVQGDLNAVVGGFHLMDMKVKESNSQDFLNELTNTLLGYGVNRFYTCHCTGEQVYSYLSEKMNNLIDVRTGMVFEV